MYLRKVTILMICFFICSCGDYQSGYRDGYAEKEKNRWIVFEEAEYLKGFNSGQAEKFQEDWVSEKLTETNELQCQDIIVRADPLMFLPAEYKRIAPGIYQIDK